jgi:hypothetical protein
VEAVKTIGVPPKRSANRFPKLGRNLSGRTYGIELDVQPRPGKLNAE